MLTLLLSRSPTSVALAPLNCEGDFVQLPYSTRSPMEYMILALFLESGGLVDVLQESTSAQGRLSFASDDEHLVDQLRYGSLYKDGKLSRTSLLWAHVLSLARSAFLSLKFTDIALRELNDCCLLSTLARLTRSLPALLLVARHEATTRTVSMAATCTTSSPTLRSLLLLAHLGNPGGADPDDEASAEVGGGLQLIFPFLPRTGRLLVSAFATALHTFTLDVVSFLLAALPLSIKSFHLA